MSRVHDICGKYYNICDIGENRMKDVIIGSGIIGYGSKNASLGKVEVGPSFIVKNGLL